MKRNKFLKSFLSIFLAELIFFGALASSPITALAATEEENLISSNLISSSFEYYVGDSVFFYDDAYFNKPASEYNDSLATTSLCLAMSAFNAPGGDYTKGYRCAEDMMKKMGFENILPNAYFQEKPQTDSMGVLLGTKMIRRTDGKIQPVIVMALRGGNYESEWAGNLSIGETGDHQGFDAARNIAVGCLNDYLLNNLDELGRGKDNYLSPKVWIMGYSRASATANLTGSYLNCAILGEGKSTTAYKSIKKLFELLEMDDTDDIYVYGFEVPQGLSVDSEYCPSVQSNIHCIANPQDPVPYVAPSKLGFSRAGDTTDPTRDVSEDEFMEQIRQVNDRMANEWAASECMNDFHARESGAFGLFYNLWKGKSYSKADSSQVGKNNGEFSNSLFNNLLVGGLQHLFEFDVKDTRTFYAGEYQEVFRILCQYGMGGKPGDLNTIIDCAISAAKDSFGFWDIVKIVDLLPDIEHGVLDGVGILAIVGPIVKDTLEKLADDPKMTALIPKSELNTLSNHYAAIAWLLTSIYVVDMDYDFQHLTTAITYTGDIFLPHYPEYTFSYMRANDRNYDNHSDQHALEITAEAPQTLENIKINVYERWDTDATYKNLVATINKDGLKVVDSHRWTGSAYYDEQKISLFANPTHITGSYYVFEITRTDNGEDRQNIRINYDTQINGVKDAKATQDFEKSALPIAVGDAIEIIPKKNDLKKADLLRYIDLKPVFVNEKFEEIDGGTISVRTDGIKADLTRLLVTGNNKFTISAPEGAYLYDTLLPVYDEVFGNQIFEEDTGRPVTRPTDNPTRWDYTETSMPLYIVCSDRFREGYVYGDILYQHTTDSLKLVDEINTTTALTIENKTKGSNCCGTGAQSLEASPGDEIVMSFDETALPAGLIFKEWAIRSDIQIDKKVDGSSLSFTMPEGGVEVHAMTGTPDERVTLTFTGSWAHPSGSKPNEVDGNWKLTYIDPQYTDISFKNAANYYPVKHVYTKRSQTVDGKAWIKAPSYPSEYSGDKVFDHWEAYETDTGEPWQDKNAIETYYDSYEHTYKTQPVNPNGVTTELIVLEKIKKSITLVPVYKEAEYTLHVKYSTGSTTEKQYKAGETVTLTDRKTLGYDHDYWEGYYYPYRETVDSYGNATRGYSTASVDMERNDDPEGVYTFTMPKGDTFVTATDKYHEYEVIWTSDAMKTTTGDTKFHLGDQVKMIPDNIPHGTYLSDVTVLSGIDPADVTVTRGEDGSVASVEFMMPDSDVALETTLTEYQKCCLTTVNATAGYVDDYEITEVSKGTYDVFKGDEIKLTADVPEGSYFKEWKILSGDAQLGEAGDGQAMVVMGEQDTEIEAVLGTLKPIDMVGLELTSELAGNKLLPEFARLTAEGVVETVVDLKEVSDPWYENPAIFGWTYQFRFTLTPKEGYCFDEHTNVHVYGNLCDVTLQDDGSVVCECALKTGAAHITSVDSINDLTGLPSGISVAEIKSRLQNYVSAYVNERNGWIRAKVNWDFGALENGYHPEVTDHEQTVVLNGTLDVSRYVGEPLEYASEEDLLFEPGSLQNVSVTITVLPQQSIPVPYMTGNKPGTYENDIEPGLGCDLEEAQIYYIVDEPGKSYSPEELKEMGKQYSAEDTIELSGTIGKSVDYTVYAVAAVGSDYSAVAAYDYTISKAEVRKYFDLTVINGSGSGSYPYDDITLVGIKANAPKKGTAYKGFTVDAGEIAFTQGGLDKDFAFFYMPDSDVTITAHYEITSLAYNIPEPVAGTELATEFKASAYNPTEAEAVSDGSGTVQFYDSAGNRKTGTADNETVYTGKIKLTTEKYPGFTFADDIQITINGNPATVEATDSSHIEASIAFPKTGKREYRLTVAGGKAVLAATGTEAPADLDGSYIIGKGQAVRVIASVPEGSRFMTWDEPTGTLALTDEISEFDMPEEDITLTAQYETGIPAVEISMIAPETPDWTLPGSGEVLTKGISESVCDLNWMKDNEPVSQMGEKGNYQVQTLVTAAEGFFFTENTSVSINGELCSGTVLDDGKTMAVCHQYELGDVDLMKFKVHFDMNGHGTQLPDLEVEDGDLIPVPTKPTATGYYFDGWYKDADCINVWDFANDRVTDEVTLYAKWTKKQPIKTVTLSAAKYTFNGKVKKPTVTVKTANATIASKVSASNTNVKITYQSGRKNVGIYKVTVTGIGRYSGTLTKTFRINPKGTSIRSLVRGSKAITVKWRKQATKMASSRITGYQIRYSTSSKMTKAKMVTVKGYSRVYRKITKLKARKKYYVQVRTYKTVSGKKYYSTWSGRKAVKTK